MTSRFDHRRGFLKQSMLAVGAAALPTGFAWAQVPQYRRLDWQVFKTTPQYNSFLSALRKMQANTNANDPRSWNYWVNIHQRYCTHNIPYFYTWHRGYLYLFERQLRFVSGDNTLTVPYWDYYANPNIPSEFTANTPGNPLFASRANTNVRGALSMAPFSAALINFPRGQANAFEPVFESAPHNPVHDIIGGWMTTMQAPVDPIFWLHHANVDRMWVAWLAAGGGRKLPPKTNSYWAGTFTYSSTLTMQRVATYDNRALNYFYQNEKFPTSLPSLVEGPSMKAPAEQPALAAPPPVGSYALSYPRATGRSTFSLSGSLDIALDESPVSIQLPISAEYGPAVASIAHGKAAAAPGDGMQFRSIHLVLDEIELTRAGRNGGFFYNIYLNLPAGGTRVTSKLVGTLGPFRIAAAEHHEGEAVKVDYVITDLLSEKSRSQLGLVTVSFVRVDGENTPSGKVIGIGEARIELSTDDRHS